MKKINQFQKIQKQILEKTGLLYSLARTGHFALQGLPLPAIDQLATGEKRPAPKNYAEHLQGALSKIKKLHESDLENVKNGIYPISVLYPENPVRHAYRYAQLLTDSFRISRRRQNKISDEFSEEAKQEFSELPDYYKRNFHFQTGGYLSSESAELYEHQVEILFSGAAGAMRRMIIPQMKKHFKNSNGEGLKFLEIGSGTGSLTKFVALAFPKAQITCLDLSHEYLKLAQENLKNFKRVNYTQGTGEKTDFKSSSFDAVFSCFLFHELPSSVRLELTHEAHRILKPHGLFGCVDSLQYNDDHEFNWALDQFPVDFHEPFFKNYTRKPVDQIMKKYKFNHIETHLGFLAKCVTGVK